MTGLALILLKGAEHSRSNADKLRAWRKGDGAQLQTVTQHFEAFVRDWKTRGFLTAEDQDALIAEARS